MEHQLIKKIADEVINSSFNVAAIEMTPRMHLKIVHDLMSNHSDIGDLTLGMNGLYFMDIPITFVHGNGDYYKLLSSDLYKLRINHSNLLGIYSEKFNRLKIFISNSYKIENSNSAQFNQMAELGLLVLRLNQIEQQMKAMSH
jgi:hypothetical protein